MSPRVVKTRIEFEGEVHEELALVEGEDLSAWPDAHATTAVGKPRRRVDAFQRVTGRAHYTADIVMPGMLHARILRSPHPRARVRQVDPARALALPGVRGVLHRFNMPKTPFRGEDFIFRSEVRFVGDDVAAVAADDEETAEEALRLIDVDYEPLPFVVDLEDAIREGAPRLEEKGNVTESESYSRGDGDRAFGGCETVVEATYRTSTQLHNCLESHGAVASWDGETLTVWESTQSVFDVRSGLQKALGLPFSKIRVVCDFMGGGFGSKGGAGKYTIIACAFTRQLGHPVRCVFTRHEENLAAGNRSATLQHVRVGWRDDRIHAVEHVSYSNSGQGRWVASPTGPTNALYDIAHVSTRSYRVVTNAGALSAFRAPGYVEGTFALESALDELADRVGVDPLEIRRRHAGATLDVQSGTPYSAKRLLECYDVGAREIGWSRRKRAGARGSAPHRRRGMGMSSQIWGGGGGPPAYATVHLNPDGTAVVRAGTQDIGTGTRTIIAQLCAEELGVAVEDVRVLIGDTDAPFGPISAGSLTTASVGPAIRLAAADARSQLLGAASGLLEVHESELRVERGHIVSRGGRMPVREVFEKLENYTVVGKGARHPNPEDAVLKTFGAHFADVEVDTRTGEIFVLHIVAVHDIGRIVNPMTAASQVEGGVIQALGFALTEERLVDRIIGRVVNANLEAYKVPTVRDVPKITARFIDRPDTKANNIGSKGLGEPPIIPTAAAVANAVANALGIRLRTLPMTPARVLEALGQRDSADGDGRPAPTDRRTAVAGAR